MNKREALIRRWFALRRLTARSAWRKQYIDYCERFRFSKSYVRLHRRMMGLLEKERPDIARSGIKSIWVRFRIELAALIHGEEPDVFFAREFSRPGLRRHLKTMSGCRLNFAYPALNDLSKVHWLAD